MAEVRESLERSREGLEAVFWPMVWGQGVVAGAELTRPWRAPRVDPGEEREPLWEEYRWRSDGSWSRVGAEGPLPASIRDYAAEVTPPVRVRPPGELDAARLRALGYVDDD